VVGLGIVVYTLVLIAISFYYLKRRYQLLINESAKEVLVKNRKFLILTIIIFIGILSMEIYYSLDKELYVLPILMRWSTIFWGTYLLARIDYKEKKIPNIIILALIGIRAVFLLYEILVSIEIWQTALLYPVIGAVIGGGIILIAMILSRSGIGMGDVKMLMVIGLFVGSTEILDTMFYMFLLSAVGGACLLISKKAKMKDSIPMAPFAFAGVAMKYVILIIGG